jgi:transcriptional regulator with XRE-family HTH domain
MRNLISKGGEFKPMPISSNVELNVRLKRLRLERRMSIRSLAEVAGMDAATVYRIEHGDIASPRPQHLQRIAVALEVDVEDLYALAGYLVPSSLPSLQPYLRAKYNLPPQAAKQIDEYFTALRDHWRSEQQKEDNDDRGKQSAYHSYAN